MKTAEDFYKEIIASKDLQEELQTVSDEMLETFLKKHGCDATANDFTAFVKSMTEGELEDDGVGEINGGIYHLPIKYIPCDPMP